MHTNLPAGVTNDVGAALGGGPSRAEFSTRRNARRIYWENRNLNLVSAAERRPTRSRYQRLSRFRGPEAFDDELGCPESIDPDNVGEIADEGAGHSG